MSYGTKRLMAVVAVAVFGCGLATRSFGYVNDRTWSGAGTDTNWGNTTNWTLNIVPTTADRASFNAYYTTQRAVMETNRTISGLRFAGYGTYHVTNMAATLTVTDGLLFDVGAYFQTYLSCVLNVGGGLKTSQSLGKYSPAHLRLLNGGNTVNGGIDVGGVSAVYLSGNGNTVNGGIRVAGWVNEHQRSLAYFGHGYCGLTGAGNSFGAGAFTLDPGGRLTVTMPSDFSAMTNIAFNGGTLELGANGTFVTNTFPLYSGGFNVAKGRLWIYNDAALGSTNNGIQLGSANFYGTLQGCAADVTTAGRLDRPIVLNGLGGRLHPYYGLAYHLYLGGPITGGGELFVNGYNYTYLTNATMSVFTPNTYSGGTRVLSPLVVSPLTSLGAGNVHIENGLGMVYLRSSNSIAAGAKVYIGGVGVGRVFWPANLRVSGNFMPQIDSNSVGGISLYGSVSNGRWGENKGKVHLWAGTWGGGTGYAGPITPGPDGIYRVGSQPGDGALGLGSGANTFGGLYGTNAVEVGVPYCLELNGALLTGVGNFQGACEWNCSNTFSGPITVHQGGQLTGWTQNGGGSPFGATNGTVTLNGGLMQALAGISAERTLRKGAISIQGGCILIAGDRGYTNLVCSTLAFDSLTRLNHGGVLIQPLGSTAYSSLGAANRVKLVNEAPGLTNGIVAPWMLGANAFLSYDSATGFTNAPWTVDVTGTNFPTLSGGTDIVRVATAATLQDDPDLYALAVSNCAVSANAANDTITVRSGGLLLCGTACQVNANLVLGTAEAPVEGIVHNQINNNENNNQQPRLLGQITAAGLTKFGEGDVMLGGNNIGTLQGPIVVNQGYLVATNSVAFGSTSNWIVLNGGGISAVKDLAGKHLAVTNAIKIGPLGGLLHSGYDSPGTYIYGPISDWIDGDAGPLRICNNAVRLYGTNTYSGGTIFRCNAQFNGLCSLGTGPVRIDNGFKLSLFTFPARTVFGGRLSLNGAEAVLGIWQNPVSAGSLDGNGQVWLGEQYTTPTDLTLVIGTDNTDADFYGTIWDIPARCGNVVKTGTGNQTLWGDLTHHGATIISNGTLTVNGWIEFASSVVVKSGATLTGKGTISAPVMVEGSGRITGTLRIETNVTLGASVDFDLPLANGNSAGLTVKGISLGGAALNVMLGYAPAGGQTWTVVNNASGNPVSGQFACGAVASATYGGRTYYFRVNYAGGDGNDVTLTVIPRADGFFVW